MKQWFRYKTEQLLLRIVQLVMVVMALMALITIIFDYGFYLPEEVQDYLTTMAFLGGYILFIGSLLQLLIPREWKLYLQHNKLKYVLSALLLIELGVMVVLCQWFECVQLFQWMPPVKLVDIHLIVIQAYILANSVLGFIKVTRHLAQFEASPAQIIVLSFGTVILIGAGLLLLPKATTKPIDPVEALFTSTSAVCVTGLIVVDTATRFTTMGQMIILGLIQIGGLGIMTVTAFFSVLVGQRMSGREQMLLSDVLSTKGLAQLGSILRAVFLTTIGIELCGVVFLYLSWQGTLVDPKPVWYHALFHSISAFCNAGFSTFTDSLMHFVTDLRINFIIPVLIILGGLGFGTLRNLGSLFSLKPKRKKVPRFSVQSKIILVMTATLIILGTGLFWVLERHETLETLSWGNRVMASFFQSVTFRTAGFNTVNFANVDEATLLLGIVWMFIGAAPGSTAGGIKVTTLAILLATVLSTARGKPRLEMFRRTIPTIVLYQTLVVITMYLFVAMMTTFLLTITEDEGMKPIQLLFETVSALGTVGLSTGITNALSVSGRIFIIITMFLGRIGPFTLALAIGQRQRPAERYRYPSEKVQIG